MRATTLITIAFAVLADALPQGIPASAPVAAAELAPKAPFAGLSGFIPIVQFGGRLVGLNEKQQSAFIDFLNGTKIGDMRGLAEFLEYPEFPKNFMGGMLRFLDPLFKVPGIEKYAKAYLDWRDPLKAPFIAPMAFGPIPDGCSAYELLLGKLHRMGF